MERGRGIILRLTKLTETSLIVTWCVEGRGLVKTVAKGARRPKSGFAGKLDLFFDAELCWVDGRRSELGTLSEVGVMEFREGLRRWYVNTVCAAYFCALVEHVMEVGHGDDAIYDLLGRGLGYLEREKVNEGGFRHFEKELAKLMGVWNGKGRPEVALEGAFHGLPKIRRQCLELLEM